MCSSSNLKFFHQKYGKDEIDIFQKGKNRKVEEMRIMYRYKELLLKNKIHIEKNVAIKIVGPDCAYHLYKK